MRHRIFKSELVELSSDVSMILVCAPIEHVCPVVNNKDSNNSLIINFNEDEMMFMPLNVFEHIHLRCYNEKLCSLMQRTSLNAELQLAVLNVKKREAFEDGLVNELGVKIKAIEADKVKVEEAYRSVITRDENGSSLILR